MPDEPVPEADAQEQAEEVGEFDVPDIEEVRIPPDVPEADALEQSQPVIVEDDDFR
jgi:hypothetical protein